MNFGLIGYGKIAHKITNSIRTTEGKITAIASRSAKEDDYIKDNNINLYRSYEELLNDPTIEAVYITLPHKEHFIWTIEALKHHKAVISEKPFVLTVDQMNKVIETIKEYDGYAMEAMKTKLNVGFQSLKEDLKTLGNIKTIDVRFCGNSLDYYPETSYMFDSEQGGAINDLGTYVIGFVLGIVGNGIKDLKVNKTIKRDIDAEDIIDVEFENGCKAHMEVSTIKDDTRTGYIETDLATVEIPSFNRIKDYTIKYHSGKEEHKEFPFNGDDMSLQIQCLIDDVKNKKHDNDLNSLNDTLEVIKLIQAIREH